MSSKRDFLLVISSNLGPNVHQFGDTATVSSLNTFAQDNAFKFLDESYLVKTGVLVLSVSGDCMILSTQQRTAGLSFAMELVGLHPED